MIPFLVSILNFEFNVGASVMMHMLFEIRFGII